MNLNDHIDGSYIVLRLDIYDIDHVSHLTIRTSVALHLGQSPWQVIAMDEQYRGCSVT